MTIIFKVIDMTIGLRVSEEEEIVGLDSKEHGLASAYAGFSIMDITEGAMNENENTDLGVADYDAASPIQRAAAVPVAGPVDADTGMHKVVIIAKLSKYEQAEISVEQSWCYRNDSYPGYGMRYPERCRREISWS